MSSTTNILRLHVLSGLLLAAAGAASADTITLRPSVRVAPGAEFTLAEVAGLDGDAARALAGIVIGTGEQGAFELGADRIRQKLVVAGADMKVLEFVGARTVVRPLLGVARDSAAQAPGARSDARSAASTAAGADARQNAGATAGSAAPSTAVAGTRTVDPAAHIGNGDALAVICEMIANAFGSEARDLRLECTEEQLAKIAPKPGVRYEIARKSLLRASRVELEVIAHQANGDEFRTRVRVTPRLEREVLVATGDLRRGSTAAGDGIAVEKRLLTIDEARESAEISARDGATLARGVSRGAVLSRTDLARAAEIKRRDTVTVRREIGTIVIELDAVALEDGAVGDVITFERADARGRNRDARAFSAEVVGPGRAVIR
jgi:flagella basal body P-ring formation protein FlgA